MTKDEIYGSIKRCFDITFNAQYGIKTGAELITDPNTVFIEGGGGATTKGLLEHAVKLDGKVITIDLCTTPEQPIFIKGKQVGTGGLGNYSSKIPLYVGLSNDPIVAKYFQHFTMGVFEFWEKVSKDKKFRRAVLGPTEKASFYFDDACHESEYLIPVFSKFVIPLCKKGAIIGSHDMAESTMREFRDWMDNHEQLEHVGGDASSRLYKVK